jgi:hypothetical protein
VLTFVPFSALFARAPAPAQGRPVYATRAELLERELADLRWQEEAAARRRVAPPAGVAQRKAQLKAQLKALPQAQAAQAAQR